MNSKAGIQTHFIFFLALVKKGFMFILKKKKSSCLYQPPLSVDLTFTCSIMFVKANPLVIQKCCHGLSLY